MPDYLYLIQKKYAQLDRVKIGSTRNIVSRMKDYVTSESLFDNNSHNIWSFKILKSKWSCYQLDNIIQYMSLNHNIPYVKFIGSGGKEHYYFNDDVDKLCDFLTKIQVEFVMTKEDVDNLKISYFNIDIEEHDFCNSLDTKEIKKLLQNDINYDDIKQLLNIKDFQLKQHQIDVRQEYQNKKVKKIFHLVISPTGTGKTVIFLCIALDVIKDTKKDIMILTKRKDILDQMVRRIENDIKKFNRNNISTVLFDDIKIVNCLVNCDIDKLNKTSKKPQIYIVNFDKFTSSDKIKNNYNKINFDKFGLIIIDESHWCGAPNISKFMNHLKDETNVNVLGFSATPLRCQREHREKTEKIFSDKDGNINKLYEYSYFTALQEKNICPVRWRPINLETTDFVEEEIEASEKEEDNDKSKKYKVLSQKSYKKVWNEIYSQVVKTSYLKKGILWFRRRKDLLKFYFNMMDDLKKFKIFCTMSYNDGDDVSKLVDKCDLDLDHFNNAMKDFEETGRDALLFAVGRGAEGFDDDKIDFCVRMYYSTQIDPVMETQRMGRLNRWHNNDPTTKKEGYFITLENMGDIEEMKKSVINRLKSWITFARSYTNDGSNGTKNKDKEEQIKNIINNYVDANILEMYDIDIEKQILKSYQMKDFTTSNIRHALIKENKRREKEGDNIIDTKASYDEWAVINNHPICDELEEKGFTDFKWLFDMKSDDYIGWNDLQKVSKDYVKKYPKLHPNELYNIMLKNKLKIPKNPELYYEKNFNSLTDLFYN